MVLVDDHLAVLAIAGNLPRAVRAQAPVATTHTFQFRLARALANPGRSSRLARLADLPAVLGRVLHPPANRLVVIDPRTTLEETVGVAVRHRTNLLLAELTGAALYLGASVAVTSANLGRTWTGVMAAEGVRLSVVDL